MRFNEGDIVRHIPSGEEWVLLRATDDDVFPAGWPKSRARASDCELIHRDDGTLDRLRGIATPK